MERWLQSCAAYLALGGAESPEKTEAKRTVMAQRRVLHRAAVGAAQPLSLVAVASPWRAMSFDETLARYGTNPQLLAGRAQSRATDEGVALADRRPNVRLSGSSGYSNGIVTRGTPPQDRFFSGQVPYNTNGVNISQPLYTSGRIRARTDQTMNAGCDGQAHLDDIEQDLSPSLKFTLTGHIRVCRAACDPDTSIDGGAIE
jgi:hypothetical protein